MFERGEWGGGGGRARGRKPGWRWHAPYSINIFVSNFLTSHNGSFDRNFISRSIIQKTTQSIFHKISLLISCTRTGDNPKLMFAQKLTRVSRAESKSVFFLSYLTVNFSVNNKTAFEISEEI